MTRTRFHAVTVSLLLLGLASPGFAEERLPLTPIAYSSDGVPSAVPAAPDQVLVAGAECPTGSGSYCGDDLPYCCPGVNTAAYCAADVNGCTK